MKFITQDLDVWLEAHDTVLFLAVIVPIIWVASICIQHPGSAWGALARICACLISAVVVMILAWLAVGGWFPPAVAFISLTGLIIGVVWASIYVKHKSKLGMRPPVQPNDLP